MKKYFFSVLILATLVVFSACNKWEDPEFSVPQYTGPEANKTIADIIAVYTNAGEKMDSICHGDEQFIVKATVVSSDEGGNFYKNMVLEDETGAIQFQINTSGLCSNYPPGQTVYLNCKGLVVGNYHGVYQIGWIYNGEIGRVDGHFLEQYLTKDGLPKPLTPLDITSPGAITNPNNICRLVRIHNCEFEADVVGKPWAEETAATSRKIKSINGQPVNNLVVRTSNYAKFRKSHVPGGSGDLIGILSIYNSTYQLMLRTIDDVLEFGSLQEIASTNLSDGNTEIIGGGWNYNAINNFMFHNQATTVTDDWLISPAFQGKDVNGATMLVEQLLSTDVSTVNTDMFMIYYTTNYTGENTPITAWHQLNYSVLSGSWYKAEVSGLGNFNDNDQVRFAFRFKTDDPNTYNGQWGVKKISFQKIVSQ